MPITINLSSDCIGKFSWAYCLLWCRCLYFTAEKEVCYAFQVSCFLLFFGTTSELIWSSLSHEIQSWLLTPLLCCSNLLSFVMASSFLEHLIGRRRGQGFLSHHTLWRMWLLLYCALLSLLNYPNVHAPVSDCLKLRPTIVLFAQGAHREDCFTVYGMRGVLCVISAICWLFIAYCFSITRLTV